MIPTIDPDLGRGPKPTTAPLNERQQRGAQ
jgi:hypothetical protein